jgi:hypothetical protein
MSRPDALSRTFRNSALAVLATLALASCAGAEDEAATTAAEELQAAVGESDGQQACRLLAPAARTELEDSSGKPCADAVLSEQVGTSGTATGVDVFDTMAQVRFADDTVFLSRFDGAWLVVGAACTPQGERPYDCGITVG